MFTFEDTRYNRQEQMPEWGPNRQRMLREAKVVVIGAGGVKSTLLLNLAAGGIGYIRIVEFDVVELSNLNRQVLYRTSDVGKSKGETAAQTLQALNPDIKIEAVDARVTDGNIARLLEGVDFVVEGGDSPAGRTLVNRYCLEHDKPFVHASAQFSYGYVFSVIPSRATACFACFFPDDHTRRQHTGPVPVNGLATSVVGSLGAVEVFKWFMHYRDNMIINKRLCFSSLLLSEQFEYVVQPRRADCPVCARLYAGIREGGDA
jgi:molybdopterin-synthase adenylyltransferase